jgi:hypothetical protein
MKDCQVLTLVLLIGVLNLIDGAMTLGWVILTDTTESNPLLEPLLDCCPMNFLIIKMTFVTLCLVVLWTFRRSKLSQVGIVLLLVAYLSIVVYHAWAVIKFVL